MSDFFSYQAKPEPATAAPAAEPAQAILADLSGEDWEQLIRFAARRRFAAGAVLVQAGESDRALHFIASGQVELQGPGTPRAVRGEGEVFGLLSFLDGAPSAVTATVAPGGPAELLRITPEALQQLAAWQPRIAMQLLRDLGAHVAARLRRLQAAD
ncbi:MAG: cyclic nucleotide-binding domain-containing protein [Rubrivivax sp.]|nr:cyclic nucleotide-binding domain-containing protein [Rubrivivax sp.]MDP3611397.1 cyclic nucleotide-binding domain-containing protein [Rubrivivax sp.]